MGKNLQNRPNMSQGSSIKVAVVGASGYSGEELVHRLLNHPCSALVAITSRQFAGQRLSETFPRFTGQGVADTLKFTEPDPSILAQTAEIVFFALPHGAAAEYTQELLENDIRVIDLSADFRLSNPAVYEEFYDDKHPAPNLLKEAVYGLPELYRKEIHAAKLVASPGCYPTSILLPTVPLLKAGLIKPTGIIANSLSGVSGAGRNKDSSFLYAECNESARPYSIPKHRHLSEIEQELSLASGETVTIQFSPHLIPATRGILTTQYLAPTDKFQTESEEQALGEKISQCLEAAFATEYFVRLLPPESLPDTKNVTHTNYLDLAWRLDRRTGRLIIMSAIDNLVKGAGGQAIQSFNIMCGFNEVSGLI